MEEKVNMQLIIYWYYDHNHKLQKVFDKEKIPKNTPYVVHSLEDLSKKRCLQIVALPRKANISKLVITNDDDGENHNDQKVKDLIIGMLNFEHSLYRNRR